MTNIEKPYDKRNNKDVWDGFPEVLQSLIHTMFNSLGEYGVTEAIRYLRDNKVRKSERSGTAKLSYLRFCDRVFRNMFPMYRFEKHWKEESELIEDILICAESYIRDLAVDRDVISLMNRDEISLNDDTDLVNLSQDLSMFFCTLYWYKEEYDKFEERLEDIFEATKRNISYYLQLKNTAELRDLYDMDDFFPMEFIFWDMIGCIYHGGGAVVFPRNLIEIYEEYSAFLHGMKVDENWNSRNELVLNVEKDLQYLYELDIDRVKDEIPDDEYAEFAEQCEQKIGESKKRAKAVRKKYADRLLEHDAGSDEDIANNYHDWESIWLKARDALRERCTTIAYNTWIMPLEYYRVDRNKVMYLMWPNKKELIRHLEDFFLMQIETAVKDYEPEINGIIILPNESNARKMYYHRTWKSFSSKLGALIEKHPTLPVVIFRESDDDEKKPYIAEPSLTECAVGYVHNSAVEVEKIIAVYVNKPENRADNNRGIFEDDIPF